MDLLASRRRRRAAALAAAALLVYYARERKLLSRLRATVAPLGEAAASLRDALRTGGELARRVADDLSAFLEGGEEAEVPASLRQLLRLVQCDECVAAVGRLSGSLAAGLATGLAAGLSAGEAAAQGRSLAAAALEAASSERGRSLLECVAAAAARQAVSSTLEQLAQRARASPRGAQAADTFERVLGELDSDRGRRVAAGARAGGRAGGDAC